MTDAYIDSTTGPSGAPLTQAYARTRTNRLVIGRDQAIVIDNTTPDGTVTVHGSQFRTGRSHYTIIMPDDDPGVPIVAGAPIPFPGPAVELGALPRAISRPNTSTVRLLAGVYEVSWNVSTVDPAQLSLVAISGTIAFAGILRSGRDAANSQNCNRVIIEATSPSADIQLINDTVGDITLSSSGNIGGTNSVANYLDITLLG